VATKKPAKKQAKPPARKSAAPKKGKPAQKPGKVRGVAQSFDAAARDPSSRKHWREADSLAPNTSVNAQTRKVIRERVRYEVLRNNSIGYGMISTRVNDLIGSGPKLVLTLPEPKEEEKPALPGAPEVPDAPPAAEPAPEPAQPPEAPDDATGTPEDAADEAAAEPQGPTAEDAAQLVEREFCKWAKASRLYETLRTVERAKLIDGECFAAKITNPRVNNKVKLQLKAFECDRVCDPRWDSWQDPSWVDGIKYDEAGNPAVYRVLNTHPGDEWADWSYQDVPAENVYHFYREDRPGQSRGVSWFAPCLKLFEVGRRWTMAQLRNAETTASIVAYMTSDPNYIAPDNDPQGYTVNEVDIPFGAILDLPPGRNVGTLKNEQPNSQFSAFHQEICAMMGRCLDMPLNLVVGNSQKFNFSSARLDHLPYRRKLRVEREELATLHLDRVLADWWQEAKLAGVIPPEMEALLPPVEEWEVNWQWDGWDYFDPKVEVEAAKLAIDADLSDLAEEAAARGRRWQDVLRQKKREQDFRKAIGLESTAPPPPALIAGDGEEVETEEAGGGDDEPVTTE
jgi:lambda family phage portal protein